MDCLNKNEYILLIISLIPVFDFFLALTGIYIHPLVYLANHHYVLYKMLSVVFLIILYKWVNCAIINNYDLDNHSKVTMIILVIISLCIFLIPIVHAWNVILITICNNKPIYIEKDEYFPGHVKLETNFIIIRDSILSIVSKGEMQCMDKVLPTTTYLSDHKEDKCWKFIFLKNRGEFENIMIEYPQLSELLSDPLIENAAISMLEPNVSIPEHKGYFKGYLRYHLCIETSDNNPDKPYIIVDNEKYTWKTGESIMFDDMYNHKVVNNSNYRRIVLFLDIKRQHLLFPFNIINEIICKLIDINPLYKMFNAKQHETEDLKIISTETF